MRIADRGKSRIIIAERGFGGLEVALDLEDRSGQAILFDHSKDAPFQARVELVIAILFEAIFISASGKKLLIHRPAHYFARR